MIPRVARSLRLSVLCAGTLAFAPAGHAQAAPPATPEGVWRGTSICQARPGICHDEIVVLHVAAAPDSAGVFLLTMNKVIAGQEEFMGTLRAHYDAATGVLSYADARGIWRFTLRGREMEGTGTVPPNLLIRRVAVTRDP
ncbi:MAG: hypothetical protein JWM27_123 [Gemmatimonadetes bacterium]|nr:hypothetical protein [Gemmatimonadota bacterium]